MPERTVSVYNVVAQSAWIRRKKLSRFVSTKGLGKSVGGRNANAVSGREF